MEKFAALFD